MKYYFHLFQEKQINSIIGQTGGSAVSISLAGEESVLMS